MIEGFNRVSNRASTPVDNRRLGSVLGPTIKGLTGLETSKNDRRPHGLYELPTSLLNGE
jgi:hypothetical protein